MYSTIRSPISARCSSDTVGSTSEPLRAFQVRTVFAEILYFAAISWDVAPAASSANTAARKSFECDELRLCRLFAT